MARIESNKLLNPTKREIKNYNRDFRTSDGPNTSSFISLTDIAIPYDSYYTSRVILPSQTEDFKLNYNTINNSTFLLIKVTYNGNYDKVMEDDFDPYYNQEPSKYNISYYYEGDSGLTFPIGRLLLLNGSYLNKIEQIYLNNLLDYDVSLDIMSANIIAPIVEPASSAITISNLYYNDIITNQVDCYYSSVLTNILTTGSTEFIVNEYKINVSGYTIVQYIIPYNTIISLNIDISKYIIYIGTNSKYYTIKFLTQYDCEQAYCRILFAYTSYSDDSCRYLTDDETYKDGEILNCSN